MTREKWVLSPLTVMAMQFGGGMPRTIAADLDGVSWDQAPIPRRRHKCTPQTHGISQPDFMIERCACGGLRQWPQSRWYGRNSRRRSK